jgi:hypothetical protein
VSRIFLSHSSANNAEAVTLRDWLANEGWKDEIFLDLDPLRGIAAGERWERGCRKPDHLRREHLGLRAGQHGRRLFLRLP